MLAGRAFDSYSNSNHPLLSLELSSTCTNFTLPHFWVGLDALVPASFWAVLLFVAFWYTLARCLTLRHKWHLTFLYLYSAALWPCFPLQDEEYRCLRQMLLNSFSIHWSYAGVLEVRHHLTIDDDLIVRTWMWFWWYFHQWGNHSRTSWRTPEYSVNKTKNTSHIEDNLPSNTRRQYSRN